MACAELRGDTQLHSLAKYDKDDIRVNPPADPAQMPKGLFEKTHLSFLTRGKNLTTHLMSKDESRLYYSTLQLGVIGGVSNHEMQLLLSSENRTFLIKWWITNLLAERYRGETVVDPPVVSRHTHPPTHTHSHARARVRAHTHTHTYIHDRYPACSKTSATASKPLRRL